MGEVAEQAAPDPMPPRESRKGWFFTMEGLAEHDRHIRSRTLADVLDAVWDIDAIQRWASRSGVRPGSFIGHQQIHEYLAERFAPTTAPEGADERNGHG